MAASIPGTAASIGTQIGRYFSLTSLLPSMLFVVWIVALSGAAEPFGEFKLSGAGHAFATLTTPKVVLLIGAALLLGFVIHPLQFATAQLLEGYWGTRPFAVRLATALALRHRERQTRLENTARTLDQQAQRLLNAMIRSEMCGEEYAALSPEELSSLRVTMSARTRGASVHGLLLGRSAVLKVLATMPPQADRMLPTRLGNALRQIEDTVGRRYGLSLVAVAPHLTVAAAPSRAAYVDDTREQLDISIRLAFFGLLSAVVTTIWLLAAGWWLLVALVPYGFAYVTYRGAVAAAGAWGAAIKTCMDLDRFAMYDAMQVERPVTTRAERRRNADLMDVLGGRSAGTSVAYVRPKPPS
ncbi:hypothetical protein [Kribbella jiaozuonensis]|uniref:Uncharacterized protein n=1 Tax=Kribbella jiaozuonensis TaxID=2575441 RepID=A0A4U3M541_9ACTN|nr:hypothetical protein [Kribbella jiaozuonensis]TKK82486.1 hypothetical protein FDA38_06795 [Kribbella jiaozuonensis]